MNADCFVAIAIVCDDNGGDKAPAKLHAIRGNHEA